MLPKTSRIGNCPIPWTLQGAFRISTPTPAALFKSVGRGVFPAQNREELKKSKEGTPKKHRQPLFLIFLPEKREAQPT
jgi:hypothetical protein